MGMLDKPAACHGCPMYGDGKGFVPDEVRPSAAVVILAQNPGDYEERGERVTDYGPRWGSRISYITEPCAPAPLIGPTGFTLERQFLPVAGLRRSDTSLCNVLKCRLQSPDARGRVWRSNDMPTGALLADAVKHCTEAYLRFPAATRLVVAMGAYAWKYLDGPGSITDWRGYLKPADISADMERP